MAGRFYRIQESRRGSLLGDKPRIAASANNNIDNFSLAQGALKEALNYNQKAAYLGPPFIEEVALVNIGLVHIE